MINLDKIAAERAQSMVNNAQKVDTLERLVTKTLGVLQEQGVYALIIFLFSRSGDEFVASLNISKNLVEMLQSIPSYANNQGLNTLLSDKSLSGQNLKDYIEGDSDKKKRAEKNIREFAKKTLTFYSSGLLNDLDTLLLVRDLYEQTLTYARYNAKAIGS